MKQNAIERINGLGRVGLVISVLFSLACYIFMIFSIGIAIILHNAPSSLATVAVVSEANITMDLSEANLDSTAVKTLQGYLEEGAGAAINIGSLCLKLASYESTDNGGAASFGGEVSSFTVHDMYVLAIYVIVFLAASVVLLLFNGFFANGLKHCKNPFDEKIVHDASVLSYIFIVWGVVAAIVLALIEGFVTGTVKVGFIGMICIALSMFIFALLRIYYYLSQYVSE